MGKTSQYGVILDAGSSGTRIYVYKWKIPVHDASATRSKDWSLPKIHLKKQKKIHPGVSTFADNVASVGQDHLQELIDVALKEVPSDKIAETPIYLMATAGVRLLAEEQQVSLLSGICQWLQATTQFHIADCKTHVQVIPGEIEGLYGWLAANYLMGSFEKAPHQEFGHGHNTYGFLDMGGASAQIAFAPNQTEAEKHADNLKLVRLRHMDGSPAEYRVFTSTWLGFGANQARERYVSSLQDLYGDDAELPDPCLPTGLKTTLNGTTITEDTQGPTLIGTGNFPECLKQTYPLLGKEMLCEDDPCLLNGQHAPAIDFNVNKFVGVSEYWHTTHGVFGGKHKPYDLVTYQESVMNFCSRPWSDIANELEKRKKSPEQKIEDALQACFKASWLINILYDGIGIPRLPLDDAESPDVNDTTPTIDDDFDEDLGNAFTPVDKIDDVELSWTLGKIVLYAAGQIPPATEDQPVGFGDETGGGNPPIHFEEAGSVPLSSSRGQDDREHHRSTVNPVLGFLAFLMIAFVVGFFVQKPERRKKLSRFIPGRKQGSGRGKQSIFSIFSFVGSLFTRSRGSHTYERVLEEGEAQEFELGDAFDSSDEGEGTLSNNEGLKLKRGRTSGLATPQLGVNDGNGSGDLSGAAAVGGPGLGKLPSFLDRAGLIVRTESRERLGRKNRTAPVEEDGVHS